MEGQVNSGNAISDDYDLQPPASLTVAASQSSQGLVDGLDLRSVCRRIIACNSIREARVILGNMDCPCCFNFLVSDPSVTTHRVPSSFRALCRLRRRGGCCTDRSACGSLGYPPIVFEKRRSSIRVCGTSAGRRWFLLGQFQTR